MSELLDDKNSPPSKSSEDESSTKETSRRDFVKGAALVASGAALAIIAGSAAKLTGSVDITGKETTRKISDLPTIPKGDDADLLIRMQAELREAMAKPVEKRHWIMAIDTRKCVGCNGCTVACIAENKLPPGVVYRPVMQQEVGNYPNVQIRYFPRPCMQCDEPACVPVCPVEATWKRPDGIVAIDYENCIGCGYCVTACPFNARTRDLGDNYTDNTPALQPYEQQSSFEYGKRWSRKENDSPVGNVRKCHFCLHRLEEGQLPECVTTCIGRATFFGDANDPNSIVSQMAAKSNVVRLLEEKGTKPRVVYLI